jgi:acyl carrier protein
MNWSTMETEQKILEFLRNTHSEKNMHIDLDTELLLSGIIDSFSVANLILFLEELSGQTIEMNDQTLMSLTSVRKIHETFFQEGICNADARY